MRHFDLSYYQAMKIKNELEYMMKIEDEVMLFTLEMQSSKKLSLNGVLLSIELRFKSSLMKNISYRRQSNLVWHFLRTEN